MSSPVSPDPSGRQEPQPSPWFSKYGGESRTILHTPHEPVTHSGLAPLFPRLHPTYYAEDRAAFDHMDPYPMPSGNELDMLFTTEKYQIDQNAGLTTWEMDVLGEHLVNGWAGGHRRMDSVTPHILDRGYGVEVDESSWHPVFAKGKWYNFRLPVIDGTLLRHPLPGVNESDVWSVDVPKIWNELRVSLELANRWLRHMAHGPWLNHLVHEQRVEWMDAEPTAAELDDPRHLGPNKKPWRIPGDIKVYDGEKTLKAIADLLAPRLVWTFLDDGFHPYDSADHGDPHGRTVRHWNGGREPTEDTPVAERQPAFLSVYIHLRPLRVLLDPKSTLSERCHARWSMAITMLHELMHAINYSRHIDEIDPPGEPCYGQEWDRELGSSGIKSLFGNDFREVLMIDTTSKSGYKYGMSMVDFPSSPGADPIARLNNHPVVHVGQVTNCSPLPTAWPSSTLLESFYSILVKKYGTTAFQSPRLFSSARIFKGSSCETLPGQCLPPTPLSTTQSTLLPQLHPTLTDLHARRRTWTRPRQPWYDPAHRRWSRTPYANPAGRDCVARFAAAAHPARRLIRAAALRAESDARAVAAAAGMHYRLHLQRVTLPGGDEPPPPPPPPPPSRDWLFAVLALLTQAALPAREGPGYECESREVGNVWVPSRAAVEAGGGGGGWRFEECRRVYEPSGRDRGVGGVVGDGKGGEARVRGRLWLLERALELKRRWEVVEPLPLPLAVEVEGLLAALFRQVGFERLDEEWLDWDFEFPEYSGKLVCRDSQGVYVPWTGFPPGQGGLTSASGQAQTRAMAAQVVGGGSGAGPRGSGRRWPTKYFTVSEVGEMISDDPSGANWALLPDNQGGYDVFDVRALFKRNPDLDTETALESTELGRAIVSQELRTALDANGDKPLGKLLTWKHPEVVSEHDGRDGRDLWCTIGNVVYDITGFPFSSGKEEEALIDLAFGKKTAGDALDDLDVNDLVTRLGPYKCGFLRPTTGVPPSGRREFTLRELGRHIYPQIGMYCALDGDVYDLGRYLHSHPGGAQILHQYAGRDATDEFRHAHADWVQTLRNHSDLVVGRMVDEITDVSHMEEGELVLLGRVFDFSSFGVNEQKLFDELTPYTGTDATHALKAEDPPDALLELLKRDDLVCAKLVTGARRLITLAEFRRLNHIPSKAERQKSPGAGDTNWRVWVAVAEKDGSKKQMVYDVTLMMMFGGLEFEQKLRPWVGKEVRDPELAHVLRTKHESFVIGELRVEESKADRVSARRAQVLSDRDRYGGQRLAGSKRHAGALNDSDLEVMEPRSKRVGAWR